MPGRRSKSRRSETAGLRGAAKLAVVSEKGQPVAGVFLPEQRGGEMDGIERADRRGKLSRGTAKNRRLKAHDSQLVKESGAGPEKFVVSLWRHFIHDAQSVHG